MKLIPIVLELAGIAFIGTGIGIEITMHAHIGLITITTGSFLVATGGVIWGKFIKRG